MKRFMDVITSVDNPSIKAVAALKLAKERTKQQRFVVEGERSLATVIHAGMRPIVIYLSQSLQQQARKFREGIHIELVSDPVMAKMSSATTPSGYLGVFEIPKSPEPSLLGPGLVLARISDPGNMGTLIRTCAALGKKTVVIVEGVDVWSPKVVQASAGTFALVNIFTWSWRELVTQKGRLQLCALVVSGGKRPQDVGFTNSLLIVGSEAEGIPDEWLKSCEQKLTLPMPGNTESLNAAIAGSIALYLATGNLPLTR